MIRFEQVSKRYPNGHEGLKEISFHITPGEMVFLTGPSGAGKSTLLRLIGLLEHCTRGQVYVDGSDLAKIKPRHISTHRRKLGMIFQDHRLLHDRNVFDNVALPLLVCGYRREEIEKRVRAALKQVDLLKRERALPITLSGGEQQRVGIARAVVGRPTLLLADEPTGNLDPHLSAEIMSRFEIFHQLGMTILIASHDVGLIRRMNKRVLVLDDGRMTHDLPPGSLR